MNSKNIYLIVVLVIIFGACNFGSKKVQKETKQDVSEAEKYLKKIADNQNNIIKLADMMIENPEKEADYKKNDSLMYQWGIVNEKYLNSITGAYGKVPTDSLLVMFGGYIPHALVSQFKPEDWNTDIGKAAKEKYDMFLEYYAQFEPLVGISLCDTTIRLKSHDGSETDMCKLVAEGTYLIDLWASWCAPCRTFNRNYKKQYVSFKNKGIETISISIDDNEKAYKQAAERDDLPWADYLDHQSELKELLGIQGVPFQFLVKDGKIIKIVSSERTVEQLLEYLE